MKGFCVLSICCGLFLSSCASVSVVDNSIVQNGRLKKPSKIYVAEFDHSQGIWNVNTDDADQNKLFRENASSELQRMMIERFPEIAPTDKAPNPLPTSGMLVAGEFTRVNAGSRALRTIIGCGAGGTKVETEVKIYDLATSSVHPIYTFKTTGGSNAQPGLVGVVVGDIPGVVAGAVNAGTGLQADWERTSREIRDFILDKIGQ